MRDFLKRYKIILEVVSPVHVSDGQKVNNKDYIYDREHGKIHMLDVEKMYRYFMRENKTEEFEKYYLQQKKRLREWFYENKYTWKDYSKWIEYSTKCSENEIGKKEAEVHLFTKNKYGQPYIPGSSLKGALRTALVARELAETDNIKKHQKDIEKSIANPRRRNYNLLSREIKSIENEVFVKEKKAYNGRDPVEKNDKMSGIKISDSKPLDIKDLVIGRKVDLKLDGSENRLPVFRECLKPGTKIEFDLTVDTSYHTYDVEDILDAVNLFFDFCLNQSEKFEEFNDDSTDLLYLGAGTGYVSKTLMYELFEDKVAIEYVSDILNSNFRNHKHYKDSKMGVSPRTKKCTYYDGKRYEFGLCRIEIQDF